MNPQGQRPAATKLGEPPMKSDSGNILQVNTKFTSLDGCSIIFSYAREKRQKKCERKNSIGTCPSLKGQRSVTFQLKTWCSLF
jgi:hypothetical protein